MRRMMILILVMVYGQMVYGQMVFSPASDENDFIHRISDYGRFSVWSSLYGDEDDLVEVMTAYDSPEAFMQELRKAMRANPEDNPEVHEIVWDFIDCHRHRLPFAEEDFDYFISVLGSEKSEYERKVSLSCLAACKREEALPVLRRMLEENDEEEVFGALLDMGEYGEQLPEEDIDRMIALLADTRDIDIHPAHRDEGDWFLASHVMQALGKIGPKAVRAYDVIIRELIDDSLLAENYDAAKFAAFLEKIRDPGLTPEAFWRLVEEVGLRVKEESSMDNESFRLFAERALHDNAEEQPPMPREIIKHDIGNSYKASQSLLKLNPDDPRGQFLLLEHALARYEITSTGPTMQFVNETFLAESRVLLPVIDLLLRYPEMTNSDLAYRFFRNLSDDPAHSVQDEDLEKIKLKTLAGVLWAAFEFKLTEAECLRYAGIYLDMPAMPFLPSPARALALHQQEHREALAAMMKVRMETEDKDSPAYEGAEECLLQLICEAFKHNLTEAECLHYAKMYLDMPEHVFFAFDFDDPAKALAIHQRKHREALAAMMKARMETEDKDSPAYESAEDCLTEMGIEVEDEEDYEDYEEEDDEE